MQEHALSSRSPSTRSLLDSETFTPQLPARSHVAALDCHPAREFPERAEHFRIRHDVFVVEQRIFADSDRDVHDDEPTTIHVIGLVDGIPAGAVRLYPLGDRLWKGDRLAVLHRYRRAGIGRPLVKCAVALAASLGGIRMDAQIQLPNVNFFKILGWSPDGKPAEQFGVLHQHMSIPLR